MLNRFLVPASRLAELPDGFDPPLGVIVDVDELPPLSAQVEVVEARLERAHATEGVTRGCSWRSAPATTSRWTPSRERGAGAKVRCGGPTPDMFPSPAELAHFVCGCRDRGLAFKATAGLHHPIRDGIAHGFLNLLGAAVLAHAEGAAPRDLVPVLLDEDAAAFEVTDEAFSVRGHALGAEAVAATRERLFVGYGSCSFSEPVEDLRGLRIL